VEAVKPKVLLIDDVLENLEIFWAHQTRWKDDIHACP
jgi:hypothetical protein